MLKRNLHKALALLASVVILCTVLPLGALFSAGADGENVVVNGDFENGKDSWAFNSGTADVVTDAHGGSNAIQLTNPGMWSSAAEQTVPAESNSQYKIVWYSKRVSGTGAFNLYVMNAAGYANLETVSGKNWMNETSGNWVKNEYVVNTAGATSVVLKFSTEANNPGSILLDDVTMFKVGGGNTPDQPIEPSASLLVNGDFETGDKAPWTVYGSTVVSADAASEGSYGLNMVGTGDWGGLAFQDYTVEVGKTYVIKMKLKAVENGVNIQIQNPVGNNVANEWFNATTWTEKTFEYTATTTDARINICGGGNNLPTSVYLDEVVVYAKGEEPGEPDVPADPDAGKIFNGDFETGTADNWNTWQSTAITEDAKYEGSYGAHIQGNGDWGGMLDQKFNLTVGKSYELTFWCKVNANGFNWKLEKGDGNVYTNGWVTSKEWTQVKAEFTAEYAEATLNFCGGGNGVPEDAYIDSVTLTELVQASNDGYIVNGDFETGAASPWTIYGSTAVSADAAYKGSYGLNMIGTGDWGGLAFQDYTVEVGKTYVIKMMLKTVDNGVNIQIQNPVGNNAANEWFNATTWTEKTFEYTATSTDARINICGAGNNLPTGVYLDNVSVSIKGEEPGDPDVPVDPDAGKILNGDFETGDLSGWTPWQQTVLSADAKHDGAYGVQLKGNGGWGGMLEQNIGLVSGKSYILSFWCKVNANGFNWKLEKDASSNYAAGWITANQWTKVTADFTAETTSAKLNFCGSGNNIAEDAYIDDVTLIEKPSMPTELVNGDFEKGDEGWTLNSAFAAIVDTAHGGTKALQLTNPSAWNEAAVQSLAGEPNTNYVIKWYSKRVEGVGAFNLIAMDGNNENLTSVSGQNWMNETSGNWVENECVVATGADGVLKIKFTAEANDAGIILLDDITIAKEGGEPDKPIDPAANLVVNGDFSDGTNGWTWAEKTKLDEESGYISGKPSALLEHDKEYGEALTQMITVEKNTDYVIIFYTKRISGNGSWDLFLMDGDTLNNSAPYNIPTDGNRWFNQGADAGWVKTKLEFNSAEITKVFFKFGPEAENSGVFLLDDVSLHKKGYEPADPIDPIVPESGMTLNSYGVLNNRPISADKNLLVNGNFESTGGQWDVDTFHTDLVSVVADSTTLFGDKSLYFNTSALTEAEAVKNVFWMELQPDTSYVFSTWIKGALLADDNRGRATVGVVDANGKFLADREIKFLDGTRQLVPTAWDNQWHLRSVEFNTGSNTTIGIALAGWGSKMWIDDMALFVAKDGAKYVSENMAGGVSLSFNCEYVGCDDKDSLIPDPNMKKADESKFWAGSYGWRNGFISFVDNEYEYGASMKYTSTRDAAATYIIKWVDVEPNTQYTFAVDLKILEDGFGRIALLDNKKRDKVEFFTVSFDSYDYEDYENTGWRTVYTSFNTDVYDKIGIAFVDDGGEVLLDNMRLFKNTAGKNVVDEYIAPPVPPTDDEYLGDDEYIENEEPVEEEEDPQEEQETKKKKKKKVKPAPAGIDPMVWVWVGVGSAVALGGAAVVIILLVNKRKKAAAAAAANAAAETATEPPVSEESAE